MDIKVQNNPKSARLNRAIEVLKAAPDILSPKSSGKDVAKEVIDLAETLGEYIHSKQSTDQPSAS